MGGGGGTGNIATKNPPLLNIWNTIRVENNKTNTVQVDQFCNTGVTTIEMRYPHLFLPIHQIVFSIGKPLQRHSIITLI